MAYVAPVGGNGLVAGVAPVVVNLVDDAGDMLVSALAWGVGFTRSIG